MIPSSDLAKCIEYLATLLQKVHDDELKTQLLYIGYVLKNEYQATNSKERKCASDTKNGRFDINLLLADNKQLYHDNEVLRKQNAELKDIINQTIPRIEQMYDGILNSAKSIINQ